MNELFPMFLQFRKILCLCPCCGDIVRLSDLRLKTKGPAAETWLDNHEKELFRLEKKIERFENQEEKLREKARDKGRKEAEKVFNKAISPKFRALKLDPFDIKPVLHPIDFVVFKGMNKNDSVNNIMLLSRECKNHILCKLRKHIQNLVLKNKYEWSVARVSDDGKIKFER